MNITATLHTNKGDITLELYPDEAPITVANFVNLAQRGYYDGVTFHRVVPNFVVQAGCPLGTGTGGPGYEFEDEFHPQRKHDAPGILSMANRGPGTNGSQFFITHTPTPHLDSRHSVFGKVVADTDMKVVNDIAQGDTINRISLSGDVDTLLEQQSEHVAQWNKVLG